MSGIDNNENLNEIIASNLKRLRKERELSLDKVSELTGVSKSMLGQIERGESSPSVSILWKISTGLRISFTSLMTAVKPDAVIINNRAMNPLTNESDTFQLFSVFPFAPGRNFEILHIDMKPGSISESSPHEHGTEEFTMVYEGELTLHLQDQIYRIPAGHSIHYKADQKHCYENRTDKPVQVCMIIYYAY